jgi:hypothetical protein
MPTSGGNFDSKLKFDPQGRLIVKGPFTTDPSELMGHVMIRFLLISKKRGGLIAESYGFFKPEGDESHENHPVHELGAQHVEGEWSVAVPWNEVWKPTARVLGSTGANVEARGVAIAVLVTKAAGQRIPAIQTLTWCQDVVIRYPAARRVAAKS